MLEMIKENEVRVITCFKYMDTYPLNDLVGSRVVIKEEGPALGRLGWLISATGRPDVELDERIEIGHDLGGITIHHTWSVDNLSQLTFLSTEKRKHRVTIKVPVCPFCSTLLLYYCRDGHDFGFERKCGCGAQVL